MPALLTRAFLIGVIALALSACGRAGDPLTPHQSAVKQAKEDGTPEPEKPVNDRRFILDGLLE